MNVRRRVWEIVQTARAGDNASRVFDVFILWLIFLNVVATILGTVHGIYSQAGRFLDLFEIGSVTVFTIEYTLRLWSCSADPRFSHPLYGRLRFAIKPMLIIDLLAILPFYLPVLGVDLRSLRALRLLRILRIAKIGRYYSSLLLIKRVLQHKKEELVLTSVVMVLLLVISSSILFYCENPSQPEIFSSIPATMWWSIATLTTVGYGDMYPVTALGKVFAALIALLGIGMFALPTGILGAGFVEEIQQSRAGKDQQVCPRCGHRIDDGC